MIILYIYIYIYIYQSAVLELSLELYNTISGTLFLILTCFCNIAKSKFRNQTSDWNSENLRISFRPQETAVIIQGLLDQRKHGLVKGNAISQTVMLPSGKS